MFSATVREFWLRSRSGDSSTDHEVVVVADPDLPSHRPLSMLETLDGKVIVVGRPELTGSFEEEPPSSAAHVRDRLEDAGITLHGADYVYYFAVEDQSRLRAAPNVPHVRALSTDDADAFAAFESATSEQDRDDAFVELDHWAVFGFLDQGRILSASSLLPWQESSIVDIGVLTVPRARGRGHGRALVHAAARFALDSGLELQYRCQLDNGPSRALASSAGLTLFGTWEVVSHEDES